MGPIYIFLNDQVTEHAEWPGYPVSAIGCFSYEPCSNNTNMWGRVVASPNYSEGGEFMFIASTDVPTTVPTLYRTMALLLT